MILFLYDCVLLLNLVISLKLEDFSACHGHVKLMVRRTCSLDFLLR